MRKLLYTGLIILFIVVAYNLSRQSSTSCYAPPRDQNTVLPFVDPVAEPLDSQTEVFKDASGWLNMREHPLSDKFQSNAYAGADMGDFAGIESSAGVAPMTVIPTEEQYEYNPSTRIDEYIPSVTSKAISPLGQSV
jgi:hypothetical protein